MPKFARVVLGANLQYFSRLRFAKLFILIVAWKCVAITHAAAQIDEISPTMESSSSLLEDEDDVSQFEPEPPENLAIEVHGGSQVSFLWDPPRYGEYSRFQVQLDPLTMIPSVVGILGRSPQRQNFFVEEPQFLLKSFLEPGASYSIKIYSELNSILSMPVQANFTTRPNPPERFVVWYRNETALLIYWQPPSGVFDLYKAEITPRGDSQGALLVSKEDYQTGELQPGFYDLVPGRAYNISVVTISQGEESLPLIKQYRTLPSPPQNVTVSSLDLDQYPSTIMVQWVSPIQGDFDGFSIYINHPGSKPVQKFVPRSKPTSVHVEDELLEVGETYQIIVKTLSGKVASTLVTHNFTYFPKSIL